MWNIEQGLKVVRAIQQNCREYGYHLAIGGGVVNKGESEKDLDLYFLPMGGFNKDKKWNPDGMLEFLTFLWGTPEHLDARVRVGGMDPRPGDLFFESVDKQYEGIGEGCYKHAVKFNNNGKRIDCFIFKTMEDK